MRQVRWMDADAMAARVFDGATVVLSGSGGGLQEADHIAAAIERRFLATGLPRDLTLVYSAGQGDRAPLPTTGFRRARGGRDVSHMTSNKSGHSLWGGRFSAKPDALMQACKAELRDHVSPEFLRCQIEVGTPVATMGTSTTRSADQPCAASNASRGELRRPLPTRSVKRISSSHGQLPTQAITRVVERISRSSASVSCRRADRSFRISRCTRISSRPRPTGARLG